MSEADELLTLRQKMANCEKTQREMIETLFSQDFVSTHKELSNQHVYNELYKPVPTVLVSILAKQKEKSLPLYLKCIEELDYPKSSIVLYIRTNNNTDSTEEILVEWVRKNKNLYRHIDIDTTNLSRSLGIESFDVHEWNEVRFKALGQIRQTSLQKTIDYNCDYYFVCDVDNFVVPWTLRNLVGANVPIIAPFLRNFNEYSFDSNFFVEVGDNGYYREKNTIYFPILTRAIKGVFQVKLVHHTYLVKKDVIRHLTYDDGSGRYEFVIFADSARRSGVMQYIDNRCIYGYITSGDEFGYTPGDRQQAQALNMSGSQVSAVEKILALVWSARSERAPG